MFSISACFCLDRPNVLLQLIMKIRGAFVKRPRLPEAPLRTIWKPLIYTIYLHIYVYVYLHQAEDNLSDFSL